MTKLQEIRDIKLQGTDLDRRSKHQHKTKRNPLASAGGGIF